MSSKEIEAALGDIVSTIESVRGEQYMLLVAHATNVGAIIQIFQENGVPSAVKESLVDGLFMLLNAMGEKLGFDMNDKEFVAGLARDVNALREQVRHGNPD